LEGATDLAILQKFAKTLEHEAIQFLERPFVKYVGTNKPQNARDHFFGLKEAKSDLVGIAIFDHLDKEFQSTDSLFEIMWKRREIENYFCNQDVLLAYVRHEQKDDNLTLDENDLFGQSEINQREQAMKEAIAEVSAALQTRGKPGPWSDDIKATDDFLDPLFNRFFEIRNLPLKLCKSEYHVLASLVPKDALDNEITEKLNAIVTVAKKARPRIE